MSAPSQGPADPAGSAGRLGPVRSSVDAAIRALDAIDRWVIIPVCVLALLVLATLSTGDAVVRYVAKSSIPHLGEFTGDVLMPAIVFLALSFVGAVRGHVAVDLLLQHVGERTKKVQLAAFDVAMGVVLLVIALQHLARIGSEAAGAGSVVLVPPATPDVIVAVGCLLGACRMAVCALAGALDLPLTRIESSAEAVE